MKRFVILIALSIAVATTFITPPVVFAETFSYLPPGDLIPGSGTGRVDYHVYFADMRFPVEKAPAYANSQVYGVGGMYGPWKTGGECNADNYSYPWRDNYCEKRGWNMPLCPAGIGHQGQDIRPSTCEDSKHWTVAAEGGTITYIGSYSVNLQGDSGIRHSYLHLNHGTLTVWEGKRVEKGDKIGKVSDNMGATPTTIHLHYTMKSGGVYIPTYMSLVRAYEDLLGISIQRAAVPHGADFDGNGLDDIFWYAPGAASDHVWYSQGRNDFASVKTSINGSYIPIAGDFDGDGLGDIFWYAAGSAADWIYYGVGHNAFTPVQTAVSGTYIPIAGDFDGNGQTDIFWYGPGADSDSIWYYFGNTRSSVKTAVWGTYQPIAGDFNGDGKGDIFWYAAGDAADWIWYGQGYNEFSAKATAVQGSYIPVSGDYNGDGRTDIFWYGPGADSDHLWIASGDSFSSRKITVSGTYLPVQGDFDGDGFADIFWYGPGADRDRIWFGTDSAEFVNTITAVSGVYTPVP